MKKVIVILILAVYIASIAVVNFGGLQVVQHDRITYVKTIQCNKVTFLGDNEREIEPQYFGTLPPMYTFDFIPPEEGDTYSIDDDNPNVLTIDWEVMPHDASNEVEFIFDVESGAVYYHEMTNSFVILRGDIIFDVTIRALDGSKAETTISIWSRVPEE